MKIYFLRHGAAADPGSGSDFDRPLTEEGRERIAREAKAMRDLNLDLDTIVTSPLVRAKETAAIVAKTLKLETPIEDSDLGPGFDLDGLERILNAHDNADAIMLVGHEPNMSSVIGRLVGGARIDLKKGGVACVDLPDPSSRAGILLFLAPPKMLS